MSNKILLCPFCAPPCMSPYSSFWHETQPKLQNWSPFSWTFNATVFSALKSLQYLTPLRILSMWGKNEISLFFLDLEGSQCPQLTHIKWMSFALQSSSRYVSFCPGCGQIGNIAARRRITAARPNPPNRGGWSKELPQYRALMATILYWSSGPLSGHLMHELQYTNNLQ